MMAGAGWREYFGNAELMNCIPLFKRRGDRRPETIEEIQRAEKR